MGIKASLIHHVYSRKGAFLGTAGFFPLAFRQPAPGWFIEAVRLAFPDEPRYAFAAELDSPAIWPSFIMFLRDAVSRGIKPLFLA